MTKQELIEAIKANATSHHGAGVSKVVIEAVLSAQGEAVSKALAKGGDITLPGLGKLSVKTRAARTGRNPATGEEMKIPAKKVPHFSAAKALKDAVAQPVTSRPFAPSLSRGSGLREMCFDTLNTNGNNMAHKYPSTHAARHKELGEIHRRAELLGMDAKDKNEASEYRSMLWAVARVHSAAALDWAGRRKVLDHLKGLMAARGIPLKPGPNAGKPANVKPGLIPLMGKIAALLADMKLPWKYLTSSKAGPPMLKRLAGVDRIEWADADGLRAIVAALARRQAKLRENPPSPVRGEPVEPCAPPFVKGGWGGISGEGAP